MDMAPDELEVATFAPAQISNVSTHFNFDVVNYTGAYSNSSDDDLGLFQHVAFCINIDKAPDTIRKILKADEMASVLGADGSYIVNTQMLNYLLASYCLDQKAPDELRKRRLGKYYLPDIESIVSFITPLGSCVSAPFKKRGTKKEKTETRVFCVQGPVDVFDTFTCTKEGMSEANVLKGSPIYYVLEAEPVYNQELTFCIAKNVFRYIEKYRRRLRWVIRPFYSQLGCSGPTMEQLTTTIVENDIDGYSNIRKAAYEPVSLYDIVTRLDISRQGGKRIEIKDPEYLTKALETRPGIGRTLRVDNKLKRDNTDNKSVRTSGSMPSLEKASTGRRSTSKKLVFRPDTKFIAIKKSDIQEKRDKIGAMEALRKEIDDNIDRAEKYILEQNYRSVNIVDESISIRDDTQRILEQELKPLLKNVKDKLQQPLAVEDIEKLLRAYNIMAELRVRSDGLKRLGEAKQRELKSQESDLIELKRTLEDKELKIKEGEGIKLELANTRSSLSAARLELKKSIDEELKKIRENEMVKNLVELVRLREVDIESKKTEIEKLADKVVELERELGREMRRKQNSVSKEVFEEEREKVTSLEQELEGAKASLKTSEAEHGEALEQIGRLNSRVEKLEEANRILTSLHDSMAAKAANADAFEQIVNTLALDNDVLSDDLAKAREKISALEETKKNLLVESEQIRNEILEKEKQISELQKSLENAQATLSGIMYQLDIGTLEDLNKRLQTLLQTERNADAVIATRTEELQRTAASMTRSSEIYKSLYESSQAANDNLVRVSNENVSIARTQAELANNYKTQIDQAKAGSKAIIDMVEVILDHLRKLPFSNSLPVYIQVLESIKTYTESVAAGVSDDVGRGVFAKLMAISTDLTGVHNMAVGTKKTLDTEIAIIDRISENVQRMYAKLERLHVEAGTRLQTYKEELIRIMEGAEKLSEQLVSLDDNGLQEVFERLKEYTMNTLGTNDTMGLEAAINQAIMITRKFSDYLSNEIDKQSTEHNDMVTEYTKAIMDLTSKADPLKVKIEADQEIERLKQELRVAETQYYEALLPLSEQNVGDKQRLYQNMIRLREKLGHNNDLEQIASNLLSNDTTSPVLDLSRSFAQIAYMKGMGLVHRSARAVDAIDDFYKLMLNVDNRMPLEAMYRISGPLRIERQLSRESRIMLKNMKDPIQYSSDGSRPLYVDKGKFYIRLQDGTVKESDFLNRLATLRKEYIKGMLSDDDRSITVIVRHDDETETTFETFTDYLDSDYALNNMYFPYNMEWYSDDAIQYGYPSYMIDALCKMKSDDFIDHSGGKKKLKTSENTSITTIEPTNERTQEEPTESNSTLQILKVSEMLNLFKGKLATYRASISHSNDQQITNFTVSVLLEPTIQSNEQGSAKRPMRDLQSNIISRFHDNRMGFRPKIENNRILAQYVGYFWRIGIIQKPPTRYNYMKKRLVHTIHDTENIIDVEHAPYLSIFIDTIGQEQGRVIPSYILKL